jgi:deoxyhypusine synthase
LIVDLIQDIRALNCSAMQARKTGMVILGGGVVKHHICNANLMRNGADFAVFVNTGQEFDGSDAGARPDEAVSWGKIKMDAKPVKVFADASLVFPLLVAQTFARVVEERKAAAGGDASASASTGACRESAMERGWPCCSPGRRGLSGRR